MTLRSNHCPSVNPHINGTIEAARSASDDAEHTQAFNQPKQAIQPEVFHLRQEIVNIKERSKILLGTLSMVILILVGALTGSLLHMQRLKNATQPGFNPILGIRVKHIEEKIQALRQQLLEESMNEQETTQEHVAQVKTLDYQ